MDDARFQEARNAYDAGDYRAAARLFLAAAGGGVDGNGAAYHMAGNALVRLRRYADAVTVYGHALNDRVYDKHGPVSANRATAQAALAEYADAVASYEVAIDDPGYKTPYRALQGMASALLEMGRTEDAASAYRKAALDEQNPNPGASLVNLGLCFMALGRPLDAAEAYKAALGFDTYAGRGKALANLGQAYHAAGLESEAVRSFEQAINMHGHALSSAAQADYEIAVASVRPAEPATAAHETVDGWVTGELPPAIVTVGGAPPESSGWNAGELEALGAGEEARFVLVAHDDAGAAPTSGTLPIVVSDDEEVDAFINRTEAEMRERDREMRRAERLERRGVRNGWPLVVGVGVSLTLLVIGLAALYFAGFGWPTQRQTAIDLLDAQLAGRPVDAYWVAVPTLDVKKEMAKIPPAKAFTVVAIEANASTSTVSVTVTPESGSLLHYRMTLQREGVGWRVSGIENDWQSTGSTP